MGREVLTVSQICEEYGMNRKRVIRYMQDAECRTLPRAKGEWYLIIRENWEDYLGGKD